MKAIQISPWCITLTVLLFVALRPAQAVQRVDYQDLTSDQLLATDSIRNSEQDVQIIGDRLIVRIEQPCPTGGRYQWQAVFRAVTTFQREATGPHELVADYSDTNTTHEASDSALQGNVGARSEQGYWRRRWEADRNQARGVTIE